MALFPLLLFGFACFVLLSSLQASQEDAATIGSIPPQHHLRYKVLCFLCLLVLLLSAWLTFPGVCSHTKRHDNFPS